jgi:hypothetical protein
MHLTDEQLNEYLDNELADRAQAKQHLDECADCAARLAALEELFDELGSLPEVTLSRSIREAPPWGAAPFTRTSNLRSPLPRSLRLTVVLQAVIAVVAIILAAPFVANLLPTIETPSLTDVLMQIKAQWTAWLDLLSRVQMPTMPEFSLSIEVSTILLVSTLAGLFMFWIVGNGLLLRDQINKRRIP